MKIIMSLIIALISVISLNGVAFSAETVLWYLIINNEKITYSVDVEQNIGTQEMVRFNHALKIILNNSNYSNINELENVVNRSATGDIRNFSVVDITVDER